MQIFAGSLALNSIFFLSTTYFYGILFNLFFIANIK